MAYQIIEPLIDTSNITALGIPINGFKPIYLTNDQAFQNLKTLLLTRKGERYSLPTFGTDLLKIIFEPNTNLIKERIEDIIMGPVSYWLPYINITDIIITTPEDDPTVNYDIQIKISFSVGVIESNNIISFTVNDSTLEVA
jgi:phage baseplate assembly protein W